ncbi:hydrogenase maturation protease [Rhodoblastus acidophilus]|uniref:Hydrogenase maturation protease n=1 Tax=Candidatus Rhodoblastus alkanivorans TaxID=2954117 RepID=A0ABS9ZB25_9HYPH|nr:hydrogenase maturation protease [Candidatus Rhodoblastus alkanivorans]MCI4684241.1 hydrogenase maturation protease [Candidatus Rhodoblastus alkanivorans]MDI4641561.1 hydrogenase maturation protease [Rhodoblastus acidophilus]
MRLVVFGWGNEARGDDALGPLLLARIAAAQWPDSALIEDFQLQLEHVLDLQGAELALFLDAGRATPAPFAFSEIFPRKNLTHTSHALAPESVLAVYEQTLGGNPPPAFLLCMRGENFDLGAGLSDDGAARLEQAWAFLQRLEAGRSAENWRRHATKI